MHTSNFKTYVNTGKKEPEELNIEYIPSSDMVVFSIAKQEIFTISYNDDLEIILKAIEKIRDVLTRD